MNIWLKNAWKLATFPIAVVAKIEMGALYYASNVAFFFGILPILGTETSGRKYTPHLAAYRKGFEAAAKVMGQIQIGQAMAWAKLGIIEDSTLVQKICDNNMAHVTLNMNAADHAAYAKKLHSYGLLSDLAAQSVLKDSYKTAGSDDAYQQLTRPRPIPQRKSIDQAFNKTKTAEATDQNNKPSADTPAPKSPGQK